MTDACACPPPVGGAGGRGKTITNSYFVFGGVRTSSGSTSNPFKFVGRLGYYDDPSRDFQYLRARYHGPAYGRFWSTDPTTNRPTYGYGASRPSALTDPRGTHTKEEEDSNDFSIINPPPGQGCLFLGTSFGAVFIRGWVVGSGIGICYGWKGMGGLMFAVFWYTCDCRGLYAGAGLSLAVCVGDSLEETLNGFSKGLNFWIGEFWWGRAGACGMASVSRLPGAGFTKCTCEAYVYLTPDPPYVSRPSQAQPAPLSRKELQKQARLGGRSQRRPPAATETGRRARWG